MNNDLDKLKFPLNWKKKKLKEVVDIKGRIGYRGYTVNDIVDENEGAITLGPSNIINMKVKVNNKPTFISWEKYYESPEIQINKNDLVFCKTGSTYGKCGLVETFEKPMTINPQLVKITPRNIDVKYLNYFLNSQLGIDQIETIVGGSTMPTISQEKLLNLIIYIPNINQQKKIVLKLEEALRDIDKIITITKQSIEELKKYKQSLITEVVTKGLDKNVEMKDSEIEWIGQIPSNWNIRKLSNLSVSYSGGTPKRENTNYWLNGDIPWVSSGEVNKGFIEDTSEKITSEGLNNSSAKIFPKDTVLVALNGQGKTKAKSAILKIEATTNQSLVGFICNQTLIMPEFLNYLFKASYLFNRSFYAGGDKREGIAASDLKQSKLPVPSLKEQINIISHLNNKVKKIDNIVNLKIQIVNEYEAYKKSLIYEYVTGKKEVGEEVE